MTAVELQHRITSIDRELTQKFGAKSALETKLASVRSEIDEITEQASAIEKATWLLQQYADEQQKALTESIEGTVTQGLRAVFQDDSLEFKLKYSENKSGEKKRTPEVVMYIKYTYQDGQVVEASLKNALGGGIAVVTATLLRVVVCLHLAPRVKEIIIMDEPLKDLSPAYEGQDPTGAGYRQRMAEFLKTLTEETELQLIFVSHEPEYGDIADVHHRFEGKIGNQTKVTTIINED